MNKAPSLGSDEVLEFGVVLEIPIELLQIDLRICISMIVDGKLIELVRCTTILPRDAMLARYMP